MGDSSQDDDTPEFRRDLEIAMALSLESLEWDRRRREKFERFDHVSSLTVSQDTSNTSGRSSPVPLSSCLEDGSRKSPSTTRSNVSRPRPARKTSLSGTVLLPPPRPRRYMSCQNSVASSTAQAFHQSHAADLMSFASSGESTREKSDPEFDPLLKDSFQVDKKLDSAFAVVPVGTPLGFEHLKSTPVIRQHATSLPGPLPLSQWNFPPPLASRSAQTARIGRVSLSSVPPSPYQRSPKCDDLIDLSAFDGLRSFNDKEKLWISDNNSGEIWKSFDPLLSQMGKDEGRSKRPKSGEYFKLWESESEGEAKQEALVQKNVEELAPQAPLRTHSVKEERIVEDVKFDGVELRQSTAYTSQNLTTTRRLNQVSESMKVLSHLRKSALSELEAFRDAVVQLRRGFSSDDHFTNVGLVISPTLERLHEDQTSVRLSVHSEYTKKPITFTCDVNTTIEHVIHQLVYMMFDDVSGIRFDNYVLKVHGLDEYFTTESALADYEYVHHCQKFDEVVRLRLIETDSLNRSLARTPQDDKMDLDISITTLVPTNTNYVTPAGLDVLLEVLGKEVARLKADAREGFATTLLVQKVIQSVKAICKELSEVETIEIQGAVEDLKRVETFYRESAESVPESFFPDLEASLLEEVMSCTITDGIAKLPNTPTSRKQLLDYAVEKVTSACQELVNVYCRCFFVNFEVPKPPLSPLIKDITQFKDAFLVNLSSVHRLKDEWKSSYELFIIGCELYHGTRLLASEAFTQPAELSERFYHLITFDSWVMFPSVALCNLPRECRLVCTLYGKGHEDDKAVDAVQQDVRTPLCWVAIQLFNHNGEMAQGDWLTGAWSEKEDKRLGPAFCNTEDLHCPIFRIILPDFGAIVLFPPTLDDSRRPSSKMDFAMLETATQQVLLDTVCKMSSSSNDVMAERNILWKNRYYLYDIPQALPKVLLAVHSWDLSNLNAIYGMLNEWKPMEAVDALELLLPCFPDANVRSIAISWVRSMNPDELCDYLPQLVQAVKYEMYDDSGTVRFLLERALSSIRVMHHLFWLLRQNLSEEYGRRRITLVLNALWSVAGRAMRNRMDDQVKLIRNLSEVASKIKDTKDSARQTTLLQQLEITDGLLEEKSVCLPLSPSTEVCGIEFKGCYYFNSKTMPLKLSFRAVEVGSKPIEAIFKDGDDLRKDKLVLQMIRIMDKLWLKEGLNLRIVTFGCIPTDHEKGIVEMVKNAETLRKIQTELGLTGSFKGQPIANWLMKHNTTDTEYQQAVQNFTLSCAGYSVATYVLGICDRHNDNIMVKSSGHIFHIDFSKFLDDAQTFGGIKRDRVPFVLTADMAYVINGGDRPSDRFQSFVDICCQAFNTIRKHGNLFLNLFSLMVSSGIHGVTPEAISSIQEKLMPEASEYDAARRFTRMIESSLKSWSTQLNFFIHNLAQLGTSGGQHNDTLLSFVPRTYTLETDKKLKKIEVVGYRKYYEPEKYYVYIISIERYNEAESSSVLRTYGEFCEFQQKLCIQFPLAKYHSLPKVILGRANIRQVAEKRKNEIEVFLGTLWSMADEVKHCDLVYTFFHPLVRDLQEKQKAQVRGDRLNEISSYSREGIVTGEVNLSIHYVKDTLFVMIRHVRNLSEFRGQPPDAYVKTYLLPDLLKNSKRRTKVVRKNCHPTFMAMLVYNVSLEVAKQRHLRVTVWTSLMVENAFLGAVEIRLADLDLTKQTTRWYKLSNMSNFRPR